MVTGMGPYGVGTWLMVERDPFPPVECVTTHVGYTVETTKGIGFVQMTDEGLLFGDPSNARRQLWFIGRGRQGRTEGITRIRTSR